MKDNEQVTGRNSRDMSYDEWLAKFDKNNKPKRQKKRKKIEEVKKIIRLELSERERECVNNAKEN